MRLLLLLTFLLPLSASAQWTWLPERPVVPALLADPLEPASGVQKDIGSNRIEARVGVLRDLLRHDGRRFGLDAVALGVGGQAIMQLQWRLLGQKSRWEFPFGFDKQVDFPLETGDYSFSLYGAAMRRAGPVDLHARLHVVHVSAHLGDGRFDAETGTWRDGRAPIDYSRNYLQLALDAQHRATGLRVYIAPAAMGYHSPPGDEPVPRGFLQAGAEWRAQNRGLVRPFAGADVRTFPRLSGTDARTGTSLVAGVRLGAWDRRALELRLARYAGASWRGQYYGLPERAWSVGFRVRFDD
jgi:hypothetical protein